MAAISTHNANREPVQFKQIDQINKLCRIGWIAIPALQSEVLARVTSFPHGISVEYICPSETSDSGYKRLTSGLFYWKNQKVKMRPESPTSFRYEDRCFRKGCESAYWYPENAYRSGELVDTAAIYPDHHKVYENVPELGHLFGKSHTTQIDREIPSVKFENWDQAKNYWQHQYSRTEPQLIDSVIEKLNPQMRGIVSEWLRQVLEKSGYSEEEIREIIRQYLFERTVNCLRWSDTIDVRDFLDEIGTFPILKQELREEMMAYLEEDGRDLYQQMTAKGKILCNPGLRQQD